MPGHVNSDIVAIDSDAVDVGLCAFQRTSQFHGAWPIERFGHLAEQDVELVAGGDFIVVGVALDDVVGDVGLGTGDIESVITVVLDGIADNTAIALGLNAVERSTDNAAVSHLRLVAHIDAAVVAATHLAVAHQAAIVSIDAAISVVAFDAQVLEDTVVRVARVQRHQPVSGAQRAVMDTRIGSVTVRNRDGVVGRDSDAKAHQVQCHVVGLNGDSLSDVGRKVIRTRLRNRIGTAADRSARLHLGERLHRRCWGTGRREATLCDCPP